MLAGPQGTICSLPAHPPLPPAAPAATAQAFLTRRHLAIVMELVPGTTLYNYILGPEANGQPPLPVDDARWLFQMLVVGLDYMHRSVAVAVAVGAAVAGAVAVARAGAGAGAGAVEFAGGGSVAFQGSGRCSGCSRGSGSVSGLAAKRREGLWWEDSHSAGRKQRWA